MFGGGSHHDEAAMSEHDQTIVDRSRTLVGGARQLVRAQPPHTRGGGGARQQSRDVLDTLSLVARTSHDELGRTVSLRHRRAAGRIDRRQHDRLSRPGRRQTDRRTSAAEQRRVLLVGADEAWRLLTTYLFEEAGYSVHAAADACQALALSTRLLPDVLLVQMEADTLDLLARLAEASKTCDIPVVVLTSSLQSPDARLARAAGGVTMLPHPIDVDALVGEVDTLIGAAPRAQRTLKRRLLELQEIARSTHPMPRGRHVCAT